MESFVFIDEHGNNMREYMFTEHSDTLEEANQYLTSQMMPCFCGTEIEEEISLGYRTYFLENKYVQKLERIILQDKSVKRLESVKRLDARRAQKDPKYKYHIITYYKPKRTSELAGLIKHKNAFNDWK